MHDPWRWMTENRKYLFRTRRRGPLAEQLVYGSRPLGLACGRELLDVRSCWGFAAPHDGLRREKTSVLFDEAAVKDYDQ